MTLMQALVSRGETSAKAILVHRYVLRRCYTEIPVQLIYTARFTLEIY